MPDDLGIGASFDRLLGCIVFLLSVIAVLVVALVWGWAPALWTCGGLVAAFTLIYIGGRLAR